MPTTANLERLGALTATLARLGAAQRGQLIRAEDWNTLVNALLEVARALLDSDAPGGVPAHEHAEEVALGWLTPELRSVLQKGPLGDPVATERVLRLERQVAAIATRINDVDDGVQGVRNRLSEVVTRDFVRESDLTAVRHKVEGVADSREDVLAVRRSLDTLGVQVKAANDAAARLTVDGQPADLGALDARVKQVEALRDALRGANGELLSAAGLETRFTQLGNSLVTEADLSAALSTHVAALDAAQIESLKGGLQASLAAEVADSVGRVAQDLHVSLAQKLGDVEGAASRAVADALPALQKSALEAANANLTTALAKAQSASEALLDKRLAESDAAQAKQLDARIADVQKGVSVSVSTELAKQLPSQVSALDGKLEQLAKSIAQQNQRLDAADSAIKATQLLFDTFQFESTKSLAATKSGFQDELAARDAAHTKALSDQRVALQAEMAQRDDAQGKLFTARLKEQEQATAVAVKTAVDASRSDILTAVAKSGSFTGAGVSSSTTATGGAFSGTAAGPFSGGVGGIAITDTGRVRNLKSGAKPASKPAPKAASKPAAKPAATQTAKSAAKPVAKPVVTPAAKPAPKAGARPAAKPALKPAAKPAAKPAPKPQPKGRRKP